VFYGLNLLDPCSVIICMDPIQSESLAKANTWRAYRCAFEDFSDKVRQVQSLTGQSSADSTAIETALLELEKARKAYSSARDAVAQRLQPTLPLHTALEHAGYVKGIAALLWEVAGRPEGTARDDWFRAESIVRRANAAAATSGQRIA
jgi:hypothetical protein